MALDFLSGVATLSLKNFRLLSLLLRSRFANPTDLLRLLQVIVVR